MGDCQFNGCPSDLFIVGHVLQHCGINSTQFLKKWQNFSNNHLEFQWPFEERFLSSVPLLNFRPFGLILSRALESTDFNISPNNELLLLFGRKKQKNASPTKMFQRRLFLLKNILLPQQLLRPVSSHHSSSQLLLSPSSHP